MCQKTQLVTSFTAFAVYRDKSTANGFKLFSFFVRPIVATVKEKLPEQ